MMNEQELIDVLEETRIDWSATPESVMAPGSGVISSQADLEAYQQRDRELVGFGYWYVLPACNTGRAIACEN